MDIDKARIEKFTVILFGFWQALSIRAPVYSPLVKMTARFILTQAYRQLNKAAEYDGVEHVGNHTLRKTFGYWFYKGTKAIAMLQQILLHSHPSVTLRYIGITEEETNNVLKTFSGFH